MGNADSLDDHLLSTFWHSSLHLSNHKTAYKIMGIIKYSIYNLLIGVILYFFGFWINDLSSKSIFLTTYPVFILFFFVISILVYIICMFGLKKEADSSVFIVLGAVVVKLLLSMVFALIFIYGNRIDKIGFLISFFLPYFIYSTFEIYTLLYNLRALKK